MAKMIKSASVKEWMDRLPPDQRAALDKLRAQILAAAPGAEETISYGMPTFTLHGHLVAFGAFKKHLSFFPMSSTLIKQAPEALAYATSTGTMQFQPDKPIPPALIKKLVQARIAQNLEIAGERAKKKTAKKSAAKKKR
ncbi:MAG TPA: DUF1801 domain-containing protein [Hyphomonadaceae bacterium]|nr:DUF1801 domain-containing protein [Hyphomonadaceae bacterium]